LYSHEYIDFGFNMEYHVRALPSAAIMKNFNRTVSFPPTEALAASKLIMNWRGSV
jgi:hypothetical protein